MEKMEYFKKITVVDDKARPRGGDVDSIDFPGSFAIITSAKNTRSIFGYGGF